MNSRTTISCAVLLIAMVAGGLFVDRLIITQYVARIEKGITRSDLLARLGDPARETPPGGSLDPPHVSGHTPPNAARYTVLTFFYHRILVYVYLGDDDRVEEYHLYYP
jgi:hypothetical protein